MMKKLFPYMEMKTYAVFTYLSREINMDNISTNTSYSVSPYTTVGFSKQFL